jgi:hypothetical protein
MKKSFAVIIPLFICSTLLVPVEGQNRNQASNAPLTFQALNAMLIRDVGKRMTQADLAARIELYGIAFDPTPDAISQLRKIGARQHLINTIKRAADKISAPAGKVVATGRQPADPFIEETRKVVRDYLDELPDFICEQAVQRYVDWEGSGAWAKTDTKFFELTYNGKRESYKPITRPIERGKRTFAEAMAEVVGGCDLSSGIEFAEAMAEIFNPEIGTVLKPAGKERLGDRQAILYDFRVPKESSKLTVNVRGADRLIPGYSGTVWIDAETKKVLRISRVTDDLPVSYPVAYGETSVDYEMIKLSGLDADFLLPARAELVIHDRRGRVYCRNVMSFNLYRKFETDIKIEGAVTTPQKPPK